MWCFCFGARFARIEPGICLKEENKTNKKMANAWVRNIAAPLPRRKPCRARQIPVRVRSVCEQGGIFDVVLFLLPIPRADSEKHLRSKCMGSHFASKAEPSSLGLATSKNIRRRRNSRIPIVHIVDAVLLLLVMRYTQIEPSVCINEFFENTKLKRHTHGGEALPRRFRVAAPSQSRSATALPKGEPLD